MTTLEDLQRAKQIERKKALNLNHSNYWFTTWLTEKFTRLWIINEHIAETKVAIENCSQCNWGCEECLKTN